MAKMRRYNHAVEPLLQSVVGVVSAHDDVTAVYLFGSTARGTARPDSDIDVAVLFDADQPSTLEAPRFVIEGELERVLGRPIDLVALNDAPVDLRIRILREGRLLLDRRPAARIAFEVRTRNEAFDLEPVLARYRSPEHRQE